MKRTLKPPKGNRSQAFTEFVRLLKSDHVVGGFFSTWRSWTGSPDDHKPWQREELNWVRLTPQGDRQEPFDTCTMTADLYVHVELAVQGNDVGAFFDAWERMEVVVGGVQPTLQTYGVIGVVPTQAPKPRPSDNGLALEGTGVFLLTMRLPY